MSVKKYFVLDTNVILHDAESLLSFGNNVVVVPIDVIEELDKFKTENNELGRNAREAIRILDHMRSEGSLGKGVPIPESEGTIMIDINPLCLLEAGLEKDIPDNRIISVAYKLQQEGKHVIFVSKDMNVRIKSDALGIKTQDFEKAKINIDALYTGWREVTCAAEKVEAFYRDKSLHLQAVEELFPNQFVLLRNEEKPKQTALARRGPDPNQVVPLRFNNEPVSGISARNLEQQITLELLLIHSEKAVIDLGIAPVVEAEDDAPQLPPYLTL